MAAVILPTQLPAQTLPSGETSVIDATLIGLPGQANAPIFFAAMLAQQLGISADGQLGKSAEVVEVEDLFDADSARDISADAGFPDAFVQIQQGVMGMPVAPVTPIAAEPSAEELPAISAPGQAVGAVRGQALVANIAEEVMAGRQSVAGNSAAFADVEPQSVFAVASEALAEQSVRPALHVAPAAAPATSPVSGAIPQPVSSPAWGDVLGDRVMWMVGQQQQAAELRLNPPSLGPLEIKLSMNDGQATLTFNTHHMPVKEALEAATPRLREMFGESGINLGNVSVNVGLASQQQQGEQQASHSSRGWERESVDDDFTSILPTAVTSLERNGMVDYFA